MLLTTTIIPWFLITNLINGFINYNMLLKNTSRHPNGRDDLTSSPDDLTSRWKLWEAFLNDARWPQKFRLIHSRSLSFLTVLMWRTAMIHRTCSIQKLVKGFDMFFHNDFGLVGWLVEFFRGWSHQAEPMMLGILPAGALDVDDLLWTSQLLNDMNHHWILVNDL